MSSGLVNYASQGTMLLVVALFLLLYVSQLTVGNPPEISLMRAGAIGLGLAFLGRLILAIMDGAHERSDNAAMGANAHSSITPGGTTGPEITTGTQNPANTQATVTER